MKIVSINEDNLVYFSHLDPFGLLEKKMPFQTFCLGSAVETEHSDIAAALMICGYFTIPNTKKTVLIVRWLYVDGNYRGQGMGDALLSAAFTLAKKLKTNYISAYFTNDYGRSVICPDEDAFFRYHSFTREHRASSGGGRILVKEETKQNREAEPYDKEEFDNLIQNLDSLEDMYETGSLESYIEDVKGIRRIPEPRTYTDIDRIIRVSDIAGSVLLKQDVKKQNVQSISDITLPMLSNGMKRCLKTHPYEAFDGELESLEPSWFDFELSSCIVEDGEVVGLALIHKDISGDYWLEYTFDVTKDAKRHIIMMYVRTAEAFVEKCPGDTRVIIRCYNEFSKMACDKLFPRS